MRSKSRDLVLCGRDCQWPPPVCNSNKCSLVRVMKTFYISGKVILMMPRSVFNKFLVKSKKHLLFLTCAFCQPPLLSLSLSLSSSTSFMWVPQAIVHWRHLIDGGVALVLLSRWNLGGKREREARREREGTRVVRRSCFARSRQLVVSLCFLPT